MNEFKRWLQRVVSRTSRNPKVVGDRVFLRGKEYVTIKHSADEKDAHNLLVWGVEVPEGKMSYTMVSAAYGVRHVYADWGWSAEEARENYAKDCVDCPPVFYGLLVKPVEVGWLEGYMEWNQRARGFQFVIGPFLITEREGEYAWEAGVSVLLWSVGLRWCRPHH